LINDAVNAKEDVTALEELVAKLALVAKEAVVAKLELVAKEAVVAKLEDTAKLALVAKLLLIANDEVVEKLALVAKLEDKAKLALVAKEAVVAKLAVPNNEPVNPNVDIVEPVTIKLPLTRDVPTTCKDELADVIPIPTLPLEPLIVILTVPLVSKDKSRASLVPKTAVAPKEFPPWTNAFEPVTLIKDAVRAKEALVANDELVEKLAVPNSEPVKSVAVTLPLKLEVPFTVKLPVIETLPVNW
jgi:hypothetical protein